jgi:glutamate racemase
MVEAGQLNGQEVDARLHYLLDPLADQGIDHLVLGCTHYPFLAPAIQQVMGDEVALVDPAPAVAKQVKSVLASRQLLAPSSFSSDRQFVTTAAANTFAASIRRLVGVSAPRVKTLSLT